MTPRQQKQFFALSLMLILATCFPSSSLNAHCCPRGNHHCLRWLLPTISISLFSTYCTLHLFRTPERFKPTPDNLHAITIQPTSSKNTLPEQPVTLKAAIERFRAGQELSTSIDLGEQLIHVNRGINNQSINKTTEPLWLLSCGFMGHRPDRYRAEKDNLECSLNEAKTYLQNNIINGPCITFDYKDTRRTFNFGQETDVQSLATIYSQIPKGQDLILIGSCRGATTALNYLTKNPPADNLKAVILESPAISLKHLTQQVAKNYLDWLPKSRGILHNLFKFWFPNYNPKYPTFVSHLKDLPHDLPIFIGHLKGDKVIADEDIKTIIQTLKETGHSNVYLALFEHDTITHARLSRIPAFRQTVNAFFKKHGLPHHKGLAEQGATLLEQAKKIGDTIDKQAF